jgi:hypothetical protein
MVSFTLRPIETLGKIPYCQFFGAVDWAPERLIGRFGEVKNFLPLPRFEPRIIGCESVAPKFYLP